MPVKTKHGCNVIIKYGECRTADDNGSFLRKSKMFKFISSFRKYILKQRKLNLPDPIPVNTYTQTVTFFIPGLVKVAAQIGSVGQTAEK